MNHALYRKYNDGSHNSSKYHKLDGTPIRVILKEEAAEEINDGLTDLQDTYRAVHLQRFFAIVSERYSPFYVE